MVVKSSLLASSLSSTPLDPTVCCSVVHALPASPCATGLDTVVVLQAMLAMLLHMSAPKGASSRRLVAVVLPVATKLKQQVYFSSIQHECLPWDRTKCLDHA